MFSGKLAAGVLALSIAGCGLTDPKDNLANFVFEEVPGGQVEAGMDATGAGRQVLFVGRTPTPTRCYNLIGSLTSSTQNITVSITARPKNEACASTPGGFSYTGEIQMARAGAYHLTIRHIFPSGTLPMTTFTKDVIVQ